MNACYQLGQLCIKSVLAISPADMQNETYSLHLPNRSKKWTFSSKMLWKRVAIQN